MMVPLFIGFTIVAAVLRALQGGRRGLPAPSRPKNRVVWKPVVTTAERGRGGAIAARAKRPALGAGLVDWSERAAGASEHALEQRRSRTLAEASPLDWPGYEAIHADAAAQLSSEGLEASTAAEGETHLHPKEPKKSPVKKVRRGSPQLPDFLRSHEGLRQAFLAAEILGPPRGA